ncbi:MAG TPA: transposase [Opitutaceae bacterium]
MRKHRQTISADLADSYYHVTTRTVNGEELFGAPEKEVLRKIILSTAEFCGVQIITHAEMINHFHLVARVPMRSELSDAELFRRFALLHPGTSIWRQRRLRTVELILERNGPEAAAWRARQLRQMNDISAFVKLVKQRFSIWFNRNHARFGTLWAERFKSNLLQLGPAVLRMTAYTDLNGFRAGLCADPKDYRFCGYAEAVAGNGRARQGAVIAMGIEDADEALLAYRLILMSVATYAKNGGKTVTADQLAKVIAAGGSLSFAELLACKCRYLTDGAVLGSKAFVMEQIVRMRKATGRGQKTVPRDLPEAGSELAIMVNVMPAAKMT